MTEVVMITGASAGVGRATARAFAERGAKIGLLARGLEGLDAAKREVEELGGEGVVIRADVADAGAVEAAADILESAFGPIDIWINNAMASVFSPIKELQADEVRRVTEVTYLGTVHGTLAALKRMLPRDRGLIIQIGSALAYRGIPLQAPYCAAKHAVQGFTDSLHSELIHDKSQVRVTTVNLPALNTPQFDWVKNRLPGRSQPVPPIYQPELAARAIVWCVDHHRRELNVGWPTTKAIIANAIAPSFVDRYVASMFDGQQAEERENPERPNNLWQPLPGDRGVHGRFGDRAKGRSLHITLNLNREKVLLAAGAVALFGVLWSRTHRSHRSHQSSDPATTTKTGK